MMLGSIAITLAVIFLYVASHLSDWGVTLLALLFELLETLFALFVGLAPLWVLLILAVAGIAYERREKSK